MNLDLPSDIDQFLRSIVHQGRFDSEQAAVIEGMRLLMAREALKEDIELGVNQLDAGQWLDEDAVFDRVDMEITKVQSSSKKN